MRKRFPWLVAVATLISIAGVLACSTKYSSSANGLVVIASEGGGPLQNGDLGGPAMETFSINLSNGGVAQINNVNGPAIPGIPGAVLLDPTGTYAYVATTMNCTPTLTSGSTLTSPVQAAILSYQLESDGKLAATSGPQYLTGNATYPSGFPTCGLDDSTNPNPGNPITGMAMDSSGKYLFVTTATTGLTYINPASSPVTTTITLNSPGISVFSIASGTITEISGSPFAMPVQPNMQAPNPSAITVTRTTFPVQFAPCSTNASPGTEDIYVTDSVNYMVVPFSVNMSTGALTVPQTQPTGVPTGGVPLGVAVDPCNRFVYVTNSQDKNVSAYTICSVAAVNTDCQQVDYSLHPVPGSPYAVSPGDNLGPITVDAYGSYLYVVATGSNLIAGFKINSSNGALSALSPTTAAAGQQPNAIAVRSDDSFVFVTNGGSPSTLSEYAIIPATGALSPESTIGISTFDLPTGVAVK